MTPRHPEKDSPTTLPEARYTVQTLLVVVVVTIIVTVLALEVSGRIEHSNTSDGGSPIGEFTAVHVKPGEEDVRMSPKSSELHGVCEDGFLAIASDADRDFFGILLDYKNRGVRCGPYTKTSPRDPAANGNTASDPAPAASGE